MQCWFLRRKGWPAVQVAEFMGISLDTVYSWDKEITGRMELPSMEMVQDSIQGLLPASVDACRRALELRKVPKIGAIKLAKETGVELLKGTKALVEQQDVSVTNLTDDELDGEAKRLLALRSSKT
jgi:hypothetical protein